MNVNEENIEAYILDFYEGNLLPNEIEFLYSFLNANPSWKKIFDEFELVKLDDDYTTLNIEIKLNLKKPIVDQNIINETNIDEYFVKSIENDLSVQESEYLHKFLELNPRYLNDLKLYQFTKLSVDENIIYRHKHFLKSTEGKDVNKENIELYLIRQLENDLKPAEEEKVNEFLDVHKKYQLDKKIYSLTKLSVEEHIIYPFKNRLKKELKTPIYTLLVKYASVAAVILLATFYVNVNNIVNLGNNPFLAFKNAESEPNLFSNNLTETATDIKANNSNNLISFASERNYTKAQVNTENELEEYIQIQNINQSALTNSISRKTEGPSIKDFYITSKQSSIQKKIYKNIQPTSRNISIEHTNENNDIKTTGVMSKLNPEEKIYINNYYISSIKSTSKLPDISNLMIEKLNDKAGTEVVEKSEGNKKTLNWRNVLYATAKLIKEKTKNSNIIKRKDQETSEIIAIKIGEIEIGRSFSK